MIAFAAPTVRRTRRITANRDGAAIDQREGTRRGIEGLFLFLVLFFFKDFGWKERDLSDLFKRTEVLTWQNHPMISERKMLGESVLARIRWRKVSRQKFEYETAVIVMNEGFGFDGNQQFLWGPGMLEPRKTYQRSVVVAVLKYVFDT